MIILSVITLNSFIITFLTYLVVGMKVFVRWYENIRLRTISTSTFHGDFGLAKTTLLILNCDRVGDPSKLSFPGSSDNVSFKCRGDLS
jgi:hypothetical protein